MRFCTYCGKEIADEAVICLNCGCKTQRTTSFVSATSCNPSQTAQSESQLATWSKITGIASFFVGWFVLGVTAIILAKMSKEETNGILSSSAKVGYVCGIVSTTLSIILLLLIIAFVLSY